MRFEKNVAFMAMVIAAYLTSAYAVGRRDTAPKYDPAIIEAMGNATNPPFGNPNFTCTALAIAFNRQDAVVSASSDPVLYEALEEGNYAETCWLPAACIATPDDADQAARILQIITSLETKFAVRSGGHKSSPGFASINDTGVLINLAKLTTISLSDSRDTVTVGPGNRWQAVYDYLAPHNITAIGGRVGTVGVGGFLLGGGVSYLTNQYGLGIDNIESFEVALTNGTIVTASASDHPDLYKGLRGGSSNFGIVTAYELRTYEIGEYNWEVRSYGPNQTDEVLRALAAYQLSGREDDLSRVDLSVFSSGTQVLLLYNEPVSHPDIFDAFYNITSFDQLVPPTNGTFIELLNLQNLAFPKAHVRTYGETLSHTVDADFVVEAYEIFANHTANLPPGASAAWVPIAMAANVAGGSQANENVLGLSAVPQQWHEWYMVWDDASHDEEILELAENITASLTSAAELKGVLLPYLFMNTAGTGQRVLESFGEGNVNIIKDVASKYDPTAAFQKLQNDGYLLRDLSV